LITFERDRLLSIGSIRSFTMTTRQIGTNRGNDATEPLDHQSAPADPLFSACSDAELAMIGRATTTIHCAAGDVLAKEGTGGHEFMVIVDGQARVTAGGTPRRARPG
jgi:hypothetical protein